MDVNKTQSSVPLDPNIANARKKVEEEIGEHAKAITILKHRLNEMTTISRLPSELLSEIFVCFAQGYFRSYTDPKAHSSYYSYPRGVPEWVRVAHVCHAWREIALSTPRLWSFISVTQRVVAEQLLARSKKAPLSVATSHLGYNADHKKFLETIFAEEMYRVRELFIKGPSTHIYELCANLTKPANALHTLVLSDNGENHACNRSDLIPQIICSGHFPRLRCLEIRRLAIRWANPLLSSALTNLVVTQNSYRDTMGTFEEFLSTLESMSGLQTVELTNAIPPAPRGSAPLPPRSRTIMFPHLRDIHLNSPTIDCANFLHHLSLGADIQLQIMCREERGIQDLVLSVKATLTHSDPWRTVELSRRYGSELTLRAWHTNVTFNEGSHVVDPAPFTFELSDRVIVSGLVLHRPLFEQASMFANTETFVVDTYTDWQWKDAFSVMSNLREIVVSRHTPDSMLDALSSRPKGQNKRSRSILFPRLEMLKFHDVRLASPDYDEGDEFFDRLIDCMIYRCNYYRPVQEVHITECRNILSEDITRLREIVPEVVWDEVEDIEEEDEDEEDEEELSDEDDYDPFEEEMYYDPDFDDPYGMW